MIKLLHDLQGQTTFCLEIILSRLHIRNDFVGYERLIDYIKQNKISELGGDFLEIGAFMGEEPRNWLFMPPNSTRLCMWWTTSTLIWTVQKMTDNKK
ncbi:MAG: hypothetical protein ABIE55_00580 [Candidatus Aenigmatarchaeota archaeon]